MTTKKLAQEVLNVLDVKCREGCKDPSWIGFQNGYGEECGHDIERLILICKAIIED